MFSARRYPEDFRLKAIEAVDLRLLKNPLDRTIYREVANEFGIGEQSLRLWVKKHHADGHNGRAPAIKDAVVQAEVKSAELTSAQLEAEIRTLRKKVEKLQAENDVPKRAFVVFSSEWGK